MFLEEQQLQQTGLVDEDEAVELGKVAAANFLFNANINKDFGSKRISAKLLDVEKGTVVFSISSLGLKNFKDVKFWTDLIAELVASRVSGRLPSRGLVLTNTNSIAEQLSLALKNRAPAFVKVRSYNPFKKELILALKKESAFFFKGRRLKISDEESALFEITDRFKGNYKIAKVIRKSKSSPKPGMKVYLKNKKLKIN